MPDATNTDPDLAQATFDAQAARVRAQAELAQPGRRWLQDSAHISSVICSVCGTLHRNGPDDSWLALCQLARDHAQDNEGHSVVTDFWRGAVYGLPSQVTPP